MDTDITQVLLNWDQDRTGSLDLLIPVVYGELRKIAASLMRVERSSHTLQPTAVIHEVYLRLVRQHVTSWKDRAHFFGVAARLMRQILVDHARTRHALKRGGNEANVPLTDTLEFPERPISVVALDEALDRLTAADERKARLVEMRFFAGMTAEEIAECSGIPPYTVRRELRLAQAWLHKELAP